MTVAEPASRPSAAFIDRDGTVIVDRGYAADPDEVELLPRAAEAIGRLNALRIPVVMVTNQSGIGRGLFGADDFAAMQARLEARLAAAGSTLDAVYHCPHDPTEHPVCDCRKPGLALYRQASRELDIDPSRAIFVGDKISDVAPATQLGGLGFLIGSALAEGGEKPPRVRGVADLWEAVDIALRAVG